MVIVAAALLVVTDANPPCALNAVLEQQRKLHTVLLPLPVTPVTSRE